MKPDMVKKQFQRTFTMNMEQQEKSRLFKFLKIDSIIEHLTGLIETRLELAKIELKEEVSKIAARVIALITLGFLAVMIVIFFSIWIAALLNSLIGSMWAGYGIVTGFYVLTLVLLIVFRVDIVLQSKIEDILIDDDSEEEDDEGGD